MRLLFFSLSTAFILSASATEVVVTTLLDEVQDPGTGLSLREALREAPDDVSTRITFDPQVFLSPETNTIVLTMGPLVIEKSLTIDASTIPEGVAIDANNAGHRVIVIFAGDYTVAFDSLTITGGHAQNNSGGGLYNLSRSPVSVVSSTILNNSADNFGGGIYNSIGALTLQGTTVAGNSARNGGGGIFNLESKEVTLHASTISGNSTSSGSGGGISNSSGNVTLQHTKLLGNSAFRHGGGIDNFVFGTVTLHDSTLSDNSAGESGGGISNFRNGSVILERSTLSRNATRRVGGGISNFTNGTIKVLTSTLTQNSAVFSGGAIHNPGEGAVMITASTLSLNSAESFGAGISMFGGNLVITNSVIAGNEVKYGNDHDISLNGESTISPFGKNLIGVNDTVEDEIPAGLLVGSTDHPLDPLLSPPANFGGLTATMLPLPGSPLIENGVNLPGVTSSIDQTGNPRISGSFPDLGSVEAVPFATLNLLSEDGDTIPDALEGADRAYPQLDPTIDDSEIDSDGDGSTDEEEIANMTNPLDPTDLLRVVSLIPTENDQIEEFTFNLTLDTFPGLKYSLEASTNLLGFEAVPNSAFIAERLETARAINFDEPRLFIRVLRED